jgi:Leucine-rich repeat (LRR) protein
MATTNYLKWEIDTAELPFLQELTAQIGEEAVQSKVHVKFGHIFILSLYDSKITKIPESIATLTELERLDVRYNPISEFPEGILNSKNLETLELTKTNISKLPENIGVLTKLEVLDMGSTGISKLPDSFCNLTALRELTLGEVGYGSVRGALTELPVEFGRLSNLAKLTLDNLPLKTLPESFGNLKSLKHLHIFNSDLRELPESFGNLSALQKLEIRDTPLIRLPESFGNLSALETFDLWRTEVTSLPESIGGCQNLKYVDFREGKLTGLPQKMGQLRKLETLNLERNQLTQLPYMLWPVTSLKTLNLERNPLSDQERDLVARGVDYLRDYFKQRAAMAIFVSHAVIDYEPYQLAKFGEWLEQKPEVYKVYLCEQDLSGNIDDFMDKNVPISDVIFFLGTQKSVFKSPDCAHELELSAKYQVPVYPMKGSDVSWDDMGTKGLTKSPGVDYPTQPPIDVWEEIYGYVKEFHAQHQGLYKIKSTEQPSGATPKEKTLKFVTELAQKALTQETFLALWDHFIHSELFTEFYKAKGTELDYYLNEVQKKATSKSEFFMKIVMTFQMWVGRT